MFAHTNVQLSHTYTLVYIKLQYLKKVLMYCTRYMVGQYTLYVDVWY